MKTPSAIGCFDGMSVFQFDKERRKEIAKWKKGKKIKLGGECIGFTMGTIVMFKDAFIVE